MDSPFFSIIIPTFNSEKTLNQCLNSIITQTFHNYEILLIDGLSTDSTIGIISKYSIKFPKIHMISEKDNGIYDAMNKGIKIAKGEWVYFLGSDDKLSSVNILQEIFNYDKKDFQVVYGNVKVIGNTSWAKDGDIYDGEFNLRKLLKKNICHQAIFYKKGYLKNQIGFYNTDYKTCADWDFNLRCWAKRAFLYLNITIVDFYAGGATTTSDIDEKFLKDFKNNLLNYFGKKKLKKELPKNELSGIGIKPFSIKKSGLKKIVLKFLKQL